MEHHVPLISTLAAGFGLALIIGFIAERLKIPALVGYLLAGIIIGPHTPGFIADIEIAAQLSEIGVMLLMFGVGLHFSISDLMSVRKISIPGAIVQMSFATVLGMLVAIWWGWDWSVGLVFGLCLSCASTVVLLKGLEAQGALDSMNGRIAVGWLIVEDIATVVVLVMLPVLAGLLGSQLVAQSDLPLWQSIAKVAIQISAFVAVMLIAGRKLIPWLLWHIAGTGSRELFTLAVIAAAISIAWGAAALFSVSFALGAFFAGMMLRESEFSHRAASESLPLRDAFSVLFFVAVGMLFDPSVIFAEPIHVLATVVIIVLGKSIAAMVIVLAFRYPLNTALTVAASLAQIGEFSFILAGLALTLGLLPAEALNLVLAGAIISIAINPLLFRTIKPAREWVLSRSSLARQLERRQGPFAELPMSVPSKYLKDQVVIVGFGRVGSRVAETLSQLNIPYVVAEQNREQVEALRKRGIPAVEGNAADPAVLIQAHITNAAMMVVAMPDAVNVRYMVATAKKLNPEIEIVLRTYSEEEAEMLHKDNIGTVFFSEDALASSISQHISERMQAQQ
ncbi:YbaL family putative K(+) efflux transporter [Methylophaga lonarensis]|uniref:YbaL family putative K(+) efflux transporter n=1 Tax=Methylophaga lonarensis TaxID=999151 RepID=UPI003D26D070